MKAGPGRGFTFDVERAARAFRFFENVLRLNGGEFEGQPFVLEPSQAFIVGSLFGWVETATGYRRFREAYIEQGKGNGKSPLVAGIGLYGLVADNEPRAEIYAAATKKDQAMILFRDMVAMVEQSPALRGAIKKSGKGDRVWNLYHEKSGSFARPIASDDGQSGPRPHVGILDEVHEHKSNVTVEMMRAGTKGRRQALILLITNSGHDRTSVCWEYHERARLVCSGAADEDAFFGYVCGLDKDDDPFKDESCWIKANPLLGVSVTHKYLREQVTAARNMPSKESVVRRLNFCEWTQSSNPFISFEVWERNGEDYTLADFAGCEADAGLDLSSTRDFTCCVLAFDAHGITRLWPIFWVAEGRVRDLEEETKMPVSVWVRTGAVRTVPGNAIDKQHVLEDMLAVLGEYEIIVRRLKFDRWRIEDFKAACARLGVEFEELVAFGQGYQDMSPAVEEFERRLLNNRIKHPRNPALTINAASATTVKSPAGDRKVCKQSSTGRVDGIVAALMAIGKDSAEDEYADLSFLEDIVTARGQR